MKCINIKHPEFLKLVEDTKIPSYDLDYLVAKWQEKNSTDRFPTVDELNFTVGNQDNLQYQFKVVNYALANLNQLNKWWNNKSIDKDTFWKKFQQLTQAPTEQVNLLRNSEGNNLEEKLTNFAANYSYTVEVNTAREQLPIDDQTRYYQEGDKYYSDDPYDGKQEITFEEYERYRPKLTSNSSYYSNLTVNENFYKNNPDWEYKEQRITTPLITPSIKGHAQFAQKNDIGWFRAWYNKKTGEVHVLEIQSDLFQKWRNNFEFKGNKYTAKKDDKNVWHYYKNESEINANEYTKIWDTFLETYSDNADAFTKLLQKDNNWVTFFVKSIIQDTAKQTITEVQESDVEAKVRELEREGLLEIDCKGKLKAEKGLQTNFTKGGKWKLIKDLKGYPTHKEGGVDLTIGKNGVSIRNGNTEFTAKHGLVIPKN